MNTLLSIKLFLFLSLFTFFLTDISAQELNVKKNANDEIMVEPLNPSESTFFGEGAGLNSTGEFNTFIGKSAGESNTFGRSNTFIGNSAGLENTIGLENTFIGKSAGKNNTTGSDNTFIGLSAGQQNTTASSNTFIGKSSGLLNQSGEQNTFIGRNAGASNVNANFNTIIGSFAGPVATGTSNTFLGQAAGNLTTTGFNNTFLGRNAGTNNVIGSENVFIGYSAGANEFGSNKLYISNSSAGEMEALIYGEFENKLLRFNADIEIKDGDKPTLLLQSDGMDEESGRVSLRQTNGSGADILYDGVNTSEVFAIETFSGGTSNGQQFTLNLQGNATLAGTLTQNSDRTLKKNIEQINNAANNVLMLSGYRYNWISAKRDSGKQIGVIAQEVQAVYPELVSQDKDGILSVNYSGLSAILIEAVKEQQTEIETLKKIVATQNAEMAIQKVELETKRTEQTALKAEVQMILDHLKLNEDLTIEDK